MPEKDVKRKLFLDAIGGALGSVAGGLGDAVGGIAGGLGDAVGGVTGGLGDALGGVTGGLGDMASSLVGEGDGAGVGLGIGAAAAGAGMMKKQQREMEHMYALQRVENEMAAAQFSADFQDEAILTLSRAVGRAKFVDGRLWTIHKTVDYSLGHMISDFMMIIY